MADLRPPYHQQALRGVDPGTAFPIGPYPKGHPRKMLVAQLGHDEQSAGWSLVWHYPSGGAWGSSITLRVDRWKQAPQTYEQALGQLYRGIRAYADQAGIDLG